MQFKERLTDLMRREGITNYRLARDLGTSSAVVGRWVKGTATPSGKSLEAIAKRFGVSTDYLIGLDTPPETAIPHEELRRVIAEDGIQIYLDESSPKMSQEDWEEVMEFIRFKQRRYGH